MKQIRMEWCQASGCADNARRMFCLADEIAASDMASPRERREARRVVKILKDVMDLPIADASLLAAARRRFSRLAAVLQEVQDCDGDVPLNAREIQAISRVKPVLNVLSKVEGARLPLQRLASAGHRT